MRRDPGGDASRPLAVTLVCQWYAPEPVSQPGWIVDGLIRQGADVRVLTGVPNYPTGQVPAPYSAWRGGDEVIDGVRVTRTPLFPSHDSRAVRRIANYVSWALSSALRGRRAFRGADVSLVYSSPATAAMAAMVARRRRGVPYVLLVQDVWPDSVLASGMVRGRVGDLVRGVIDLFVRRAYRGAAHVVVISPGMKDLLVSRGVPADKISVVCNWIGQESLSAVDSEQVPALRYSDDERVLMYAGNIGAAQDLGPVLDAVAEIAGIRLALVGDGAWREQLQRRAEALCTDRIVFLGARPRSEMPGLMAASDVQLVSLRDDPLFRVTIPSKLQSVLAAGQPVLLRGDGDMADVVREHDAGWVVHPADGAALRAALRDILATDRSTLLTMGHRGAVAYASHMAENVGAPRLLSHLRAAMDAETRQER